MDAWSFFLGKVVNERAVVLWVGILGQIDRLLDRVGDKQLFARYDEEFSTVRGIRKDFVGVRLQPRRVAVKLLSLRAGLRKFDRIGDFFHDDRRRLAVLPVRLSNYEFDHQQIAYIDYGGRGTASAVPMARGGPGEQTA